MLQFTSTNIINNRNIDVDLDYYTAFIIIYVTAMHLRQDRQALAPLQEPPKDDTRQLIEQAIEDISGSVKYLDGTTTFSQNLLEAWWFEMLSFLGLTVADEKYNHQIYCS